MRIILAEPQAQTSWAIKLLLEEQPDLELVGEAIDVQSLLWQTRHCPADLILVDRELSGSSIRDLIDRLHTIEPRPIVVVMSNQVEFSQVALDAGADAFISKVDDADWLLDKLQGYAGRFHRDR